MIIIKRNGREDNLTVDEQLHSLLKLRLLVAYLGEKDQAGWWDTSFLSQIGLEFLEHSFPRTRMLAGLNGACQAAQRLHDDRIGVGSVFHLFRLPFTVEQSMFGLAQHRLDELADLIKDRKTAIQALRELSSSTVRAEGPVQIGTEKKLLRHSTIDEFATHYLSALEDEKLIFPYITATLVMAKDQA